MIEAKEEDDLARTHVHKLLHMTYITQWFNFQVSTHFSIMQEHEKMESVADKNRKGVYGIIIYSLKS